MIVSLFHVTVPAEATAPFERSWQQRAGKVDAMPGFLAGGVARRRDTGQIYCADALGDSRRLRPLGQQPGVHGLRAQAATARQVVASSSTRYCPVKYQQNT